jgi:hypothetical protein
MDFYGAPYFKAAQLIFDRDRRNFDAIVGMDAEHAS